MPYLTHIYSQPSNADIWPTTLRPQRKSETANHTRGAAPADCTGIEPAPVDSRLQRGSRWAYSHSRSHHPSPSTSSLWPETQPGLIEDRVLEGERNEACGNWQAGWLWLALMERDFWHAAAETGHLISLREQENEAFPLFLPSASVSGHNRSVNRLRRANEKCMTEQSLRRLQEGLLCFYPTSSNIHRAVSPLIRGVSLIALNDEPRQVAKHPVRRSDAAASASHFRWQKAERTITWSEPENRTRTDW